jgi:hypothetical protein
MTYVYLHVIVTNVVVKGVLMLRAIALALALAITLVLLSTGWTTGPTTHAQTAATTPAHMAAASPAERSRAAIWRAAHEFGVSYPFMLALAECESHLDPTATNASSGAVGLYQFLWPTFTRYSSQLRWAPNTWLSPYNPRVAARTAAYMISLGLSDQWTCSSLVG